MRYDDDVSEWLQHPRPPPKGMLFAPAELNPYEWWITVIDRLWDERIEQELKTDDETATRQE